MLTNMNQTIPCYLCDEQLNDNRETFYFYQCQSCSQKTSYCGKCNKLMDNLLNGIFFKCCCCKVLMKVTHRESVSPQSKSINSLFNKSPVQMDRDINSLFHPNLDIENNTPMRNLFNQGFKGGVFVNNNNLVGSYVVPQQNFGQNLIHRLNQTDSGNINSFIQTPKSNGKFEKSIVFSPDQTPFISRHVSTSEKPINIRELGLNYSTPRNLNKSNFDDILTTEDFDRKLMLSSSKKPTINNLNVTNITSNYSLLSSKNRLGRIPGTARASTNTNPMDLIGSKKSEFAGYNRTEPRKSVSKSPMSLRKSKPKFGFPGTGSISHLNISGCSNNNSNPLNQSFIMSNDRIKSQITKYNNDSIQQQQKFGMTSYLSDIKPVSNYQLDSSKFSYNNDNFLKLSNISQFSHN